MAWLLERGDAVFLGYKLSVGAFAAYLLYRCAHLPVARHGMKLVLAIYGALMIVHVATGATALGWHGPEILVADLRNLPSMVLALFS
jgi:hypothetical protein